MINLPERFPVFVVNLKRRHDRRERMRASLPTSLIVTYTSDWNVDIDWRDLILDKLPEGIQLFPWCIEHSNPWWCRPLKLGEIGCSLAHIYCWRAAALVQHHYAVILEDDAIVPDTFAADIPRLISRIETIDKNWDLIYLGRVRLNLDSPVASDIVRPGYSHCTYGYVLSRKGAQILAAASFESMIMPVDEFLPAMYTVHPRQDVAKVVSAHLRAYALEKDLVGQLPKTDAGSDTEDSPFVPSG